MTTLRTVVISGVRGQTHLVHAASFLRTLTDERVRVHYLGGPGFLSATVTPHHVRRLLPSHVEIEFSTSIASIPREQPIIYIAVGAPGLRVWTALHRRAPLRRTHVVVVDEGLGTYGDRRTRSAAYRRQGGSALHASVRSAAVSLGARLLTGTRWPLYCADRSWAVFKPVADEFRRALGPVDMAASDPQRAVLLTQPWVDLGLVAEGRYLEHIAELSNRQARAGRQLMVRPHPAEPSGRYLPFATMTADRPAELDPQVVGAGLVIGASSTALLNLAALYGTPVYRTRPPGTEHLESQLSEGQRRLLARYLPPVAGL